LCGIIDHSRNVFGAEKRIEKQLIPKKDQQLKERMNMAAKKKDIGGYSKEDDKVLHQAKGHVKYTKEDQTTKIFVRIRKYKDFAEKVSVEEEGIGSTGKHWCKRHDKLPLAMVKAIGEKLFALMALAAEFTPEVSAPAETSKAA
jgi:hypothetical protein